MNSLNSKGGAPESSVIIATYSGADKLRITLSSLTRQTMHPDTFEVIIVDDGTPSRGARDLQQLADSFVDCLNVRVVRCDKNGGPARARNRGISEARGTYLFFTDDDCEVPARWIETHLVWYERMPHISHIGGWYFPTRYELNKNAYAQFWYLHYRASFPGIDLETFIGTTDQTYLLIAQNTANMSIRRHVLEIVPGFDERFIVPGREDTDFAHRLKQAGYVGLFIPLHVRHTSSLSFRRFRRVMKNRGIAHYTYLRKIHWARFSPSRYIQEYYAYKEWVHLMAAHHPGIRVNTRKLLLIGRLYYWGVGSRFALWFHGRAWQRRIRKRNAN